MPPWAVFLIVFYNISLFDVDNVLLIEKCFEASQVARKVI